MVDLIGQFLAPWALVGIFCQSGLASVLLCIWMIEKLYWKFHDTRQILRWHAAYQREQGRKTDADL